jgi:ParB-like nuclease family protein
MAHSIRKRVSPAGPPLAVVWRRIETLRSDPANPRSHSPKQIHQLTRSIGAFGFNVPILVDRTLRIIAGHGRLLAAQELGWREVPTILLDHLSEAEARAFMIADNRVAESAVWNNTLLIEQLKELSFSSELVIETTGFEATEIELLTGGGARGRAKRSRPPAARPAPATVVSPGEWWQLGPHRVGCGNLADAIDAMLTGEENVVVVLAANPAAVDAIIRRWQASTGLSARHIGTGRGFAAVAGEAPNGG